ncbi:hypothetical protein FRC08_012091 [Ceratobasidium sp. 394]|nr:hypothetical protein FRC08_012091 [Ceratobasidium sp. 394]
MLVKLKRGLRRVEKSLARPFRGLGRKPVIYLDHMDWDGPRALTAALKQNASAFEPLTAVVTTLSACIEAFDDRARARKEYEPLRTDLNDLFRGLSNYLSDETAPSETTKRRMVNLARGIDTEAGLLARGVEQNEVERGVRDLDEVFRGYRRVRALLARFTLNEITKLWKIPGERDPDTHLDRLPNPAAAWYDSVVPDNPRRNGCTPNTRVELLKQLGNWTSYSLDRRLYWLSGATGTGKTTIAYSLCEQLECSGKLAASFFCARWSPECRDAHIILPSISHQLSSFSRPFRYAIFGTINQGVDAQALPIDRQFELLIAAPLRMIGHTLPSGITIVIDALDECEDEDGVDQILSALLAHVSELPVKFFITSRPEHKIANRMQSEREDSTLLESLDDIDPSTVRGDIKTYMGAELATANPSSDNLEQLCELSGTLFEYAAIFVRYVMRGYLYGGTERMQRMQRLLRIPTSLADEGDERMDPAYSAFLEAALEVDAVGGPERAEINRVLHTVICAPEPLTAGILAGLLGTSVTRLTHYPLQALRPVLQVSSTGLVIPRHTSFRDYLLDQKRSGKLYCDAKQHNVRLVHSCLDLIRVPWHPHNGYDLDSSYLYDRENCGENESVNTAVLLHACRHWVAHLELVERSIASAAARRLNQERSLKTALYKTQMVTG